MGIEMLINAVLKATGFTREKMDAGIKTGQIEFNAMRVRAINGEAALKRIESAQVIIFEELRKIQAKN